MKHHDKIRSIGAAAGLVVAAFLLLAMPASAADPVFPPGSRIGLVPPPGMVRSNAFNGFEDPGKNAAIFLAVMPTAAYAELEKTVNPEALKKQGIIFEKREPITLKNGKGFVIIGKQASEKERYRKWVMVAAADDVTALVSVQVPESDSSYSDDVLRATLATLAVRATVPDDEQLTLLPFRVGDLAGFHVKQVLPGRAVMLADETKDAAPDSFETRLLVLAAPGGPAEPGERANFARLAFQEITGIKDVQITMSEPLRLAGQSGYQTMAQAKDLHTGTDIMVVQWLRFGSGGFLEVTGMGRTDGWADVLTRLRTVRDSIDPK